MNKKKILITMMAFALLLTGCGGGKSGAVATVDGVDIPKKHSICIIKYKGKVL